MKIIWHRISIQTLLFQACLPTRHSRPQSLLSLLAGGAFARGKGGSGDTGFDWLVPNDRNLKRKSKGETGVKMLAAERRVGDWQPGAKNKTIVKKKCSTMADDKNR